MARLRAPQFDSRAYGERLRHLGDEELLEAVHKARLEHETAAEGQLDEAFLKSMTAEAVMTQRFGIGEAEKRYDTKFPPTK